MMKRLLIWEISRVMCGSTLQR
ncbi:unnamed protein product [Linum tenue]|uniref:Uncharacterized protein n=1 Tax=Linum tenue TaxID=586396 RepID=A0AAV0QPQ4_9ROSI|nr:unnamed protein product [Linum tenue]CAI0546148.1 unnamed protein product [Linum tenue]